MSSKVDLKLDWCSHEAAKFACEHWHYSKCMPVGKIVKIGVWENNQYLGCVLFSHGANYHIGEPYQLTQNECVELVRVALNKHKTSVSRIISIAVRLLKKQSPGLRLLLSYADKDQGHYGGIYQAGGWVYSGLSSPAIKVFYNGKWSHKKTIDDAGIDYKKLPFKKVQGKLAYLMPLDKEMAKRIEPLRKPYPKKPCAGSETVTRQPIQVGEGGSIPTPALSEANYG